LRNVYVDNKINRDGAKKANRRSGAKSQETYENLDVESKTSAAKKPENALELARRLCVLANAGELGGRDVERVRAAVSLLAAQPDWSPFDVITEAVASGAMEPPGVLGRSKVDFTAKPVDYAPLADEIADVLAGKDSWLCATLLAQELRIFARRLDLLITGVNGGGFVDERRELRWTWVDETGRVRSESISGLGGYRGLLERVLAHPGVDPRRFRRCENEKCGAFFYKPRGRSRACGRKCEDVLMAREHYWLEKARREVALKLKAQGLNLREIAAALGVSMKRVRRYITANREKRDNGQKTQG
jgi:DNA-binding CsgD family transcriptional regulator